MSCFTYYRLQLWNYKMYGAEFYHWPLVDRQVISQMPSLVIAQVRQLTTLQVVTDSCGDLRFVLRELAYCIEDDRGSFQPTGWWAKFPVLQVLRAKFIECLGCTVITWVCRGEIWQKERFSRTENLVSGFPVKPLVRILFIMIEVMSTVGYNLPSCLPIYLRATYQVIEILQAKEWSSWGRSKMRVHVHLESGFSKTEQEMSWNLRVLRLFFMKWNQCLHNRLTTIWKANGGKPDSSESSRPQKFDNTTTSSRLF
jgi:hypothetical protein